MPAEMEMGGEEEGIGEPTGTSMCRPRRVALAPIEEANAATGR